MNIVVGGSWGGQQGIDSTAFDKEGQYMEVDWVRVYSSPKTNIKVDEEERDSDGADKEWHAPKDGVNIIRTGRKIKKAYPRVVFLSPRTHDGGHQLKSGRGQFQNEMGDYTPIISLSKEEFPSSCEPKEAWHKQSFPTCNLLHEVSFPQSMVDNQISHLGTGWTRDGWSLGRKHPVNNRVAFLTLKWEHDFSQLQFENHRKDALVQGRLGPSPHIINIHGYCGMSAFKELAEFGNFGSVFTSSEHTPKECLSYARDISLGLADVHEIDQRRFARGFNTSTVGESQHLVIPSVVHRDYTIWNILVDSKKRYCTYMVRDPNGSKKLVEEDAMKVKEKILSGKLPVLPSEVEHSSDPAINAIVRAMKNAFTFDANRRPSAREIANDLDKAWQVVKEREPMDIGKAAKTADTHVAMNEVKSPRAKEWKCCVSPKSANPAMPQIDAFVKNGNHMYPCPKRPSNFSWYFGSPGEAFDAKKWAPIQIYFAGGSTTRQMKDQLEWEMPTVKKPGHHHSTRFLFRHNETVGRKKFDTHMVLDMRSLEPELERALVQGNYDFIIVNEGIWWHTNSVGRVIDTNGVTWAVDTGGWGIRDWRIINKTAYNGDTPPEVTFSSMMRRALTMMMNLKRPNTTIVWRSESVSDCPVGKKTRITVVPVLKEMGVPVLNISQATCKYAELDMDDSKQIYPHLCFPSVALRHWLQEFQRHFL
ncbi:hypothetical protein ACHAXR_010670 [Thalassiosira sp. AJA248-18]